MGWFDAIDQTDWQKVVVTIEQGFGHVFSRFQGNVTCTEPADVTVHVAPDAYFLAKFPVRSNAIPWWTTGSGPDPVELATLSGVYVDGPWKLDYSNPRLVLLPAWNSRLDFLNGATPRGAAALFFTPEAFADPLYRSQTKMRVLNEFLPDDWKEPSASHGLLKNPLPMEAALGLFALPFALCEGGPQNALFPNCHVTGSDRLFNAAEDSVRDLTVALDVEDLSLLSIPGLLQAGTVNGIPSRARLRMTVEKSLCEPVYHLDDLELHFQPPPEGPSSFPARITGGTLRSDILTPDGRGTIRRGQITFPPGIHVSLPIPGQPHINANVALDLDLALDQDRPCHLRARLLADGNKAELENVTLFFAGGIVSASHLYLTCLEDGTVHVTGEGRLEAERQIHPDLRINISGEVEADLMLRPGADGKWKATENSTLRLRLQARRPENKDAPISLLVTIHPGDASNRVAMDLQATFDRLDLGSEVRLEDVSLKASVEMQYDADATHAEIRDFHLEANKTHRPAAGDITGPVDLQLAGPPFAPLQVSYWPEAGRLIFSHLEGNLQLQEMKPFFLAVGLEAALSGSGEVDLRTSSFAGDLLVGGHPFDRIYWRDSEGKVQEPPLISNLSWRTLRIDRLVKGRYKIPNEALCENNPAPGCYDTQDPRVRCEMPLEESDPAASCSVERDAYIPGAYELSGNISFASLPWGARLLLKWDRFRKVRSLQGPKTFRYQFHPASRAGVAELRDKLLRDFFEFFRLGVKKM